MKLDSSNDYWEVDATFHPALQGKDSQPQAGNPVIHGNPDTPGNPDIPDNPGNPGNPDNFENLGDDDELDDELDDDFDAPSTAPKGFTTFIWALVAIVALLATAAISFLLVK
ncbi:MAG: hypothetical protein LIP02_05425 [Bacteroidales bacterium]|nr:hypothetical protein [Bacteroidales bacterium]